MSDIKCILDTSLITEKKTLKEDLYKGQALDILILLLKGERTATEIARNLKLPIFSTRLYLSRLLKADLVKESKIIRDEKTVEKVYRLTTTKLDIINNQVKGDLSDESQKNECLNMAEHFNKMTTNAIGNIYKHPQKPYIIKSCFISASKSKMEMFKERLNALIDEFDALEDVEEEDTYGLIVNFTPYELD